jgi:hypothetical protein
LLNKLAPGTGLALAVEADRQVVAERLASTQAGLLGGPGAARTARTWFFPSLPSGSPLPQELVLFNPHDAVATVHARVGRVSGSCCAGDLTIQVPPLQQFVYKFGTQNTFRGPLTLFASNVVAAERVAVSDDQKVIVSVPGTVTTALHWYLPEVRGGAGSAVTLFNPGAVAVPATIRSALAEGSGTWLKRIVPPFSEVRVPVDQLTTGTLIGAEVDAAGQVVAGTEWTPTNGPMSMTIGSTASARAWTFIGGLAGRGVAETVSIINPAPSSSLVSIRVTGDHGGGAHWTISMPAHSHYSRALDSVLPAGGAAVTIQAGKPITVEHTYSADGGAATSPGVMLTSP